MKSTYCLILLVGFFFNFPVHSQFLHLSAAQRVTNEYIHRAHVNGDEGLRLLSFIRSLEERGLYKKIHCLYIGRHFSNGVSLNLFSPFEDDGNFPLKTINGSPSGTGEGILLGQGDKLNTHFVNDLASGAPRLSVFWITDSARNVSLSSGSSPFDVASRYDDGKSYVSIWANASGIPVPEYNGGFGLAQRVDAETVELYQDSMSYQESLPVTTSNPVGGELMLIGPRQHNYVLRIFGIADAMTADEVNALRIILQKFLEGEL